MAVGGHIGFSKIMAFHIYIFIISILAYVNSIKKYIFFS